MTVSTLDYDPVGGSDTLASGAGPATAVTGSTATNGTGNVVNLDGTPDLSGVSVNDILWVNLASTVRTLTRITAVDDGADTVTTEDTTILGAGVSWAIGGKRKTLSADKEFTDISQGKAGWTLRLDDGADYVFATRTTVSDPINEITVASTVADGPLKIQSLSGAKPVLTWSSGSQFINMAASTDFEIDGLVDRDGMTIKNVISTSTGARFMESVASAFFGFTAKHLTVATKGLIWEGRDCHMMWYSCDVTSTGATGFDLGGTRVQAIFDNCIIHNCAGNGISSGAGQTGGMVVRSCVIRDSTSAGIQIEAGQKHWIYHICNNVFHDNGTDGVLVSAANQDLGPGFIANNIFTDNGGYGINSATDLSGGMNSLIEDFNAFRGNTSGETNNILQGSSDVTLTADPYTNAVGDDYTLNATAGGGAACKDVGTGYNG